MNLVLCLTEQCNLRCKYCYYKESQANRQTVMDDATLEQAIRIALERTIFFKQQFMNITFFGGEPLLRRDAIYKGVNFAKAIVAEAMDNGKITSTEQAKKICARWSNANQTYIDFCRSDHL